MTENNLDHLFLSRKEAKAAGLSHYFTGKPCPRGHVSHRFVSTSGCKECCREKRGEVRAGDLEKAHKIEQAYRDANIEKRRAWRAANLEKARESGRNWYNRNRGRPYGKIDKEKRRIRGRNRRAREHDAEGKHTAADIARIRKAQKDRCAMPDCRIKLNGGGHVDHIKPLSKGGSNAARNLQLLCEPCNLSKSARDPVEFAQSRGLLI